MSANKPAAATAIVALIAASSSAQVVTFDGQGEGFAGFVYTENGITIRDLDARLPGTPPPGSLNIDAATDDLGAFPAFSSPNVMTFLGLSPGPGCAFGRIGSLRILPPGPRTAAAIDVFQLNFEAGNTIVFAAFLAGQEVARTTVPVGGFQILHHHMVLENVGFDELRLFGEGPNKSGVFFAVIDNVAVFEIDCYANCDGSTLAPSLNINDFLCFSNRFAAGDSYANCDGSTAVPVLNVNDFICFSNVYAAGCP